MCVGSLITIFISSPLKCGGIFRVRISAPHSIPKEQRLHLSKAIALIVLALGSRSRPGVTSDAPTVTNADRVAILKTLGLSADQVGTVPNECDERSVATRERRCDGGVRLRGSVASARQPSRGLPSRSSRFASASVSEGWPANRKLALMDARASPRRDRRGGRQADAVRNRGTTPLLHRVGQQHRQRALASAAERRAIIRHQGQGDERRRIVVAEPGARHPARPHHDSVDRTAGGRSCARGTRRRVRDLPARRAVAVSLRRFAATARQPFHCGRFGFLRFASRWTVWRSPRISARFFCALQCLSCRSRATASPMFSISSEYTSVTGCLLAVCDEPCPDWCRSSRVGRSLVLPT